MDTGGPVKSVFSIIGGVLIVVAGLAMILTGVGAFLGIVLLGVGGSLVSSGIMWFQTRRL